MPNFARRLLSPAIPLLVALSALFGSPSAYAWSGCGLQLHGAAAMGEVSKGGPVGESSTGYLPGVSAFCDVAIGQQLVVGAFAGAEKSFGDFETLGINHSFEVGGRAGFLLHPAVLFYGHVAWTRMDVTGLGNVDGIKWGPGIEIKLPASAWGLDFRYQIADMDLGSVAPGADAQIRSARIGLTYKFGGAKQVESIFTPEVSKPCDPKMANCKK